MENVQNMYAKFNNFQTNKSKLICISNNGKWGFKSHPITLAECLQISVTLMATVHIDKSNE
jgi:hypothetical protein